MKRKEFLKKAGLAAAGIVAAPYILPSGRLFAATGSRMVNHVVVCLFAGGVRNLESVQKADGNLMPAILTGTEPISPDIAPGMTSVPASPLALPLQKYGTLYKDFRFKSGPTGHYSAHTVSITGRYADTNLDIRKNPEYPTIFELYRKHSSPTKNALNAWWVSNTLGPYPALNYSSYYGYGSDWGANFIQPTSLISQAGYNVLGDMRQFTATEKSASTKMRDFLDKNFSAVNSSTASGVVNNSTDAELLKTFINTMLQNAFNGQYNDPWGTGVGNMSNDMYNIFFAEEILKEFQPELLVVNMQDVDVGHFNFTNYANNLRKADYATAHLWNTIQSTPGLANDTVMIVVPEHGRNQQPNTIMDAYGRYAVDHTAIGDTGGDQMSREIFCLVVGPTGVVVQDQVISTVKGESIDVLPTVARVLGFDTDIPISLNTPGAFLGDAFV